VSPDIGEFARGPRKKITKCGTCRLKGDVWDAVCEFERIFAAGESKQPLREIHSYLVEHYDYPLSHAAFYYHLIRRGCGEEERRRRAQEA
jgi:hypothetical protein